MKYYWPLFFFLLLAGGEACMAQSDVHNEDLKVVIIRHAEKPVKGDNLTCQGLNRSLALPAVLYKKFGIPAFIYVPALLDSVTTHHARMFQTISPFAIRYNLTINTLYNGKACEAVAADVQSKAGTVLLVWDHKAIPELAKQMGIAETLSWPDNDYDSI